MKFLQGKLYKKYYPIKNISTLYEMNEKEFDALTRWIKIVKNDVYAWNFEEIRRVQRQGLGCYRRIIIKYQKPIKELYLLMKNKQLSNLDEEDLEFINDILYRHKYNCIISSFIFPTRNNA